MLGHQLKTTGLHTSGARLFALLLLSAWLLLGSACRTAPVQEMSEARQAIEAARAAGAEQYANTELGQALSSLKTAEQMLNDRRFRDARRSARQPGLYRACRGTRLVGGLRRS